MSQKIKLGDKEYDVDRLSENGRALLELFKFASSRAQELSNLQAVLQRAQNSYLKSLKKEVISNKAGILFEEE